MFCGNYVESQYYNHLGRKKVKNTRCDISVADDIGVICYLFEYEMLDDETKRKRDIWGNNPLLMYRNCFDSKIKIHISGKSSNTRENK